MSYVKLDRGLLSSSLWIEGDAETVRVWVYLLLCADAHGTIEETLPAIAHGCKLPIARVAEVLEALASPDQHSRTPTSEGRRIVVHREPEWLIELINYGKYRTKDHTNADRQSRPYTHERKSASIPRRGTGARAITAGVSRVEQRVAGCDAGVRPVGTRLIRSGDDDDLSSISAKVYLWGKCPWGNGGCPSGCRLHCLR